MATLEPTRDSCDVPIHTPAMVSQVLDLLRLGPGQKAIDLTLGTGGHSIELARALGPDGLLVGVDADPDAVRVARERLSEAAPCRFELFCGPFSRAAEFARLAGAEAFDVALADLGVGTHQLARPERAFSFDSPCRLDMRYDPRQGPSAWDVVNRTPERQLADIFWRYGEERLSRPIAAAICRRRSAGPIDTPAELSELVKHVAARRSAGRRWRIHPATRVMMALRIYVNRELDELEALLEALPSLLCTNGRVAVLTYHSLEARLVKQAWRRQQKEGLIELLVRRPLRPSAAEVSRNPRIRSAQLRAARRL